MSVERIFGFFFRLNIPDITDLFEIIGRFENLRLRLFICDMLLMSVENIFGTS